MKKSLVAGLVAILMFSLVFAAQGNGNMTMGSLGDQAQIKLQEHLEEGNYSIGDGIKLQIKEQEGSKIKLQLQNHTFDCDFNLSMNGTKLRAQLSNGIKAEIKVMPETASETAINRLRLKVCNESNNCSLELKEVGKNNDSKKMAYEVKAQKEYKILGLFKTRAEKQIQIDAETGEVISEKKPWWSWLASEEDQ
jgi:hypothetical protein